MKCPLAASMLVFLAGCAGTPPAPPPQHADVTAPERVDEDAVMAAQESGQRVVREDGQALVCRREKKTGSHLQRQTICMTAEEWEQAAQASQQTVQDMKRQQQPPTGN